MTEAEPSTFSRCAVLWSAGRYTHTGPERSRSAARSRHTSPGLMPASCCRRTIAAIWQEVLGFPAVGIDDHFFDIGGTSLLMLRVQARLAAALSRTDLSIVLLFQHPTIRSLAAHLGSATPSAPAAASTAQARAAKLRESLAQRRLLSKR